MEAGQGDHHAGSSQRRPGDGTVWIRSQPATGKIANIRHQPRVAFNLNSDGQGAGVTLEGTASFVDDLPPGVRDEYIAK
jgi:general stress protein 26